MKKLYISLALIIGLSTSTSTLMAPPAGNLENNNNGTEWRYGLAAITFIGLVSLIAWQAYNSKKNSDRTHKPNEKNILEKFINKIVKWLDDEDQQPGNNPTGTGTPVSNNNNHQPQHNPSATHPNPTRPQNNPSNNASTQAAHNHNQTQNNNSEEQGNACVVCLEKVGSNGEAVSLSCKHTFCEGCIAEWELAQKKNSQIPTCPQCRKKITTPIKVKQSKKAKKAKRRNR